MALPLFRYKSIRTKLIARMLGLIAIGFIVLGGVLIFQFNRNQSALVDAWVDDSAQEAAGRVDAHLEQYIYLGQGLANATLQWKSSSDEEKSAKISETIQATLKEYKGVRALYFMFERGAYFSEAFNSEGRVYNNSWYKSSTGELKTDGSNDWELTAEEEYWHGPKATNSEIITGTYKWLYEGEKDSIAMTTVAIPIRVNGQFIGIIGFDLTLDDLWETVVKDIKPMGSGYAILADNAGIRAAHPKKEQIGKPLGDDMDKEDQVQLLDAIKNGKSYSIEKIAKKTGKLSKLVFKPIYIGHSKVPWTLASVFPMDTVNEPLQRMRLTALFVFLLVLTAAGFALWWLGNGIVQPIQKASLLMQDIAQGDGDLTQRLPVLSQDEIGVLSTNFNTFAEKVRQIVAQVKENSTTLAGASEELTATARHMSGIASNMSQKTSQVVVSVDQSNNGTQHVSDSLQTLSGSVNSVSAAVEEMSISIREVAGRCQEEFRMATEAKQRAEGVTVTMDNLNTAAQEISRVLDLIEDIAEQINLLALNATIEAATAGEAGKGFAVVAGEVKELAKQTASATEQISKHINGIQKNVKESMQDISGITEVIEKVNGISQAIVGAVEEQSTTMSSVAQAVSSVNRDAGTISLNVREISKGIQDVAQHATELGKSSQSTASSASGTEDASKGLSNLSNELQNLVGRFKV